MRSIHFRRLSGRSVEGLETITVVPAKSAPPPPVSQSREGREHIPGAGANWASTWWLGLRSESPRFPREDCLL
eukprot:7617457-Pyramimonas_sp.AAC.1